MKSAYKLKIEPITAVHIGSGETFTSMDYMVTDKIGKMSFGRPMYFRYSWDRILDSLKNNPVAINEFMKISNSNNMIELRNFFHKYAVFESLDALCETTKKFTQITYRNKEKDPVENASIVYGMQRNLEKDSIIPGSSIKGAIRTAIINEEYQKQKGNQFDTRDNSKFEAQLLGCSKWEPKIDPFRGIRISDCTVLFKKGTQITGSVVNVHYNKYTYEVEEKTSVQILAEFIRGELTGQNTSGEGAITIDNDLYRANTDIKKHYTIDNLVDACNKFYMGEFIKEMNKFYPADCENNDIIIELKKKLEQAVATENTFIIRIGRWSQVEFVTIDDPHIRRPKTPPKKGGGFMPWGTSRFDLQYDGQYLPIGWCKCTVEKQ